MTSEDEFYRTQLSETIELAYIVDGLGNHGMNSDILKWLLFITY